MGRKLTTEEFINKAKVIKPNYDYSNVDYINNRTKVKITCDKGHEFKITPNNFLKGHGCAKCSKNYRHSTKEFIKKAKLIKPNYDFSKVVYVNSCSKVKVACNKGHQFKITPSHLLNGKGCSKCSGNYRYSTKEWVVKAKLIKPNYDYSKVIYVNAYSKVNLTCDKGHEFKANPNNLLKGHGCPRCMSSKGEEKIRNYLKSKNIYFLEQKRFSDCKDINCLPFDFYIPSHNLLIEYDGEQHFKPIYFGSYNGKTKEDVNIIAQSNLEATKRRDMIKTEYCNKNGITLLRIPYTKFNDIESILSLV